MTSHENKELVKYEKKILFDDELSFFRAKLRIHSYNTRSPLVNIGSPSPKES